MKRNQSQEERSCLIEEIPKELLHTYIARWKLSCLYTPKWNFGCSELDSNKIDWLFAKELNQGRLHLVNTNDHKSLRFSLSLNIQVDDNPSEKLALLFDKENVRVPSRQVGKGTDCVEESKPRKRASVGRAPIVDGIFSHSQSTNPLPAILNESNRQTGAPIQIKNHTTWRGPTTSSCEQFNSKSQHEE